jgi:hypothetical protein
MRFLVTSLDAVIDKDGRGNYRKANEYFPQIVSGEWSDPWETIVAKCFRDRFQPRDGKQYIITALTDDTSALVTFNHRMPEFDVDVQKFS